MVLTVFSCIGTGSMTSAIVYVILLAAFKSSVNENIHHLQWVWRLLFGLGLVPLAITLYFRLVMPESKPYEKCKCSSHHSPESHLLTRLARRRPGDFA